MTSLSVNYGCDKSVALRQYVPDYTAVPGERWEVEYFADGEILVERFLSMGEIKDKSELEILFRDFSD